MAYKDPKKRRYSASARREYYLTHRAKQLANMKAYSGSIPEAILFLGGTCACPGCGVSEPRFLTVDHIQGRSKTSSRRTPAIREARLSGWDKTKFQILCFNCNFAKGARRFCPVHQTDPGQGNGHNPNPTIQGSLWLQEEN